MIAPPAGLDPILLGIDRTPAFVYHLPQIEQSVALLDGVRQASGCKALYSVKAFPFSDLLKQISERLDGFSVSSLFEARLASEVLQGRGTIHITTPGLRSDEIDEVAALCDAISFNSLSQWSRFGAQCRTLSSCGLRVNPQHSFLSDPRYDPCRQHSKLGVPLSQLNALVEANDSRLDGLEGLHFHTLFGSRSFAPLKKTVQRIEHHLGPLLESIKWINLGGGYLFDQQETMNELSELVNRLRQQWDLTVYFEPGRALIGDAGYLVSSVIDLFESDGKTIAVLDSSVNHNPELFEYQRRPDLAGEMPGSSHGVILAGATCLSGDLFGEYQLPQPLKLADRVIFKNVGAYSMIKANRFNGQNLPSIYALERDGAITLKRHYHYQEYRAQWSEHL